jgi:hypothetical protein
MFTSEPFDFYGGFVRINEHQKFKFAETKTVKEYQALVKALTEKDESIVSQNHFLYEEISKYERIVLQLRKEVAVAVQA